MKPTDKVKTTISRYGFPIGTLGVIHDIDEKGVLVKVYIPDDADAPNALAYYRREELE